MATLKPFAALRPKPELAAQICELPYDVMSSDEARVLAAGNLLSFLHVSKPEIDLAPGTDLYSPEVYAKGKENFQKLTSQGALKQDDQPNFYLYRQIMGKHLQVGLVAAASCEEYLANIIKKHTRANPSKNVRGGILEKEGPIHVSNVMLLCPGFGKHTRAGHTTLPDGTKTRVCRRCNTTFEH